MVIRNVEKRKEMLLEVIKQASKVSKDFLIIDHWSEDDTIKTIKKAEKDLDLNLELIEEEFVGTMDDMKWKYYKYLNNKYKNTWTYILILDWDEVLDDKLVKEINSLKFIHDVYLINRHSYFVKHPIDRNSYLPLLFEVSSVEVAPFELFHKLYSIKSKNTKKLKWILHHYSYENLHSLVNKNIFYGENEWIELYKKNPNISNIMIFLKFLFEGTIYSLYTLFYHFNFLTLEWWFYSFNRWVYKFYKRIFYYEQKEKSKEKSKEK